MHKDVEQARFNMIEQQIRTWEVLDGSVLDLLGKVPREAFVPEQYRGLAFADLEIPIGFGQTMLSPKMEGRILQALDIKPTDKVLEIGTGSGYLTALLAAQAKEVHSIEINAALSQAAQLKLAQQQISNVIFHVGDGTPGWPGNAPYDVIVFTGSLPLLPEQAQQSLNIDGRLFAVIGEAPAMEAIMIRRVNATTFRQDILFETCIPELGNAPQPARFAF
ncbi:protein-L-isoaspartate O-methyltransferase [Methylobacillus gramineus]|uniref:protein-L-isoaspartate O-methyltransferase family protein n=1 Tax=Methylobacillus gramineus TaxID=755169 RepID=UPI001CFF8D5F|nr:protein-L-isoaspartate O-methyltransferase [Methylobacillus gramineus]MCB5185906.1 protein-L-isoaspartate O-methyltransferase [Methylobacillus gramineus]